MLGFIAFLIIIFVVLALMSGKTMPATAMTIIPIIGALLAGFSIVEINSFFTAGIHKTMSVAIMFIFAILYFGIMQDAGLFDPIVSFVLKVAKNNIITICIGTVIIAAIAHLDGSGASTFLITIPMLLPIYKKLKMSPYLLVLLIGASASIMNMLPWAGPVGRAASVIDIDAKEFWIDIIPVQALGILFLIALTVILAIREKRRIKTNYNAEKQLLHEVDISSSNQVSKNNISSKKMYFFNLILTIVLIGSLISGIFRIELSFMIAFSIALSVNFPNIKMQIERVKAHASGALMTTLVIFSAGIFLGILSKSGMLKALAGDLISILPEGVVSNLSMIVGILGVPSKLILNTDAYFFALLPLISQIGVAHGVSPETTAYLMLTGDVPGTFISPFSAALWLAVGLADIDMGKYIKYSFLWVWLIGIFSLLVTNYLVL